MTSTNEDLPSTLKTRASPVDYQNADLVSRLLAATPPYLYNMPIVPHSFFFSEMLRSLVQARASENNQRHSSTVHHRRARKRSWTQAHAEVPKPENLEMFQPIWNKTFPEKSKLFDDKATEKPPHFPAANRGVIPPNDRLNCDENLNDNKHFLYPEFQKSIPNASATAPTGFSNPSNQTQVINEIPLPTQPSVWYPPLYSNAYGIDPLHFFIDLRVSGHIYDKKNQKDGLNVNLQGQTLPTKAPFPSTTTSSNILANQYKPESSSDLTTPTPKEIFKQSRHASAFSVPKFLTNRNLPVNLTQYSSQKNTRDGVESKIKFDVKSMGLDKNENQTGTSYIMKNVTSLYRRMQNSITKVEVESISSETQEHVDVIETEKETCSSKIQSEEEETLTEEEKEKRVKDLRALIGLELVVDYMNNTKPGQQNDDNQDSSSDIGSSDSPTLDVVDIHDDVGTVY